MRVRIFMDPVPAVVEERVNHWLEHDLGKAEVIKTETTGVVAAPGPDGRVLSVHHRDDLV